MLQTKCSSAINTLFALMVISPVAACDSERVSPVPETGEDFRAGPRPSGDDMGSRSFATEANYRAAICPEGTSCTTIDVNDDGKEDLVRFDHAGKFGDPGTVAAALSNGWNFGPMEKRVGGFCLEGDSCLATDITGDSLPDLVRFANEPETELWVAVSTEAGFAEPKLWAHNFCGPNQTCTAGDITGDGIADLVAFARFSDQSGTVRVYPGGKGPGYEPEVWGEGFCMDENALCRVGDVDGDAIADIVQFGRQQGFPETLVARSKGSSLEPLELWSGDEPGRLVCPEGAECQLGDFNGDWAADVIATFPEPATQSDPGSCSGTCGGSAGSCWCDESCVNYGDCCEDYQAICVSGNTCENSCGGSAGGCWCDEACTNYGDCCSDYALQCGAATTERQIQMWTSDLDSFGLVHLMVDMPCDPGESCWTADITGDGRQDLITINLNGVLELFPSRDRIDRMLDMAMRYSMLFTDHERRRQKWLAEERASLIQEMAPVSPELAAALPDRFPSVAPPPAPTPSDPALPVAPLPGFEPWPAGTPGAIDQSWVEARLAQLAADIELEANTLLNAIPDEGTLVDSAQQQRWQETIGHVIAARTAIYSPALAAGPVAERRQCNNAVLHDRYIADDGTTRAEGSYVSRFHDALREHEPDDRIWAALPALTGVVEGLRCLSEPEMAALEAAYVEAVTETMQDLLDRGKPALAQVTWDQALPIELILFDAVKHFTKPQGWRLLQVRIEAGAVVVPEFPADGSDFDQFYVEDNATCSTLRCQLYKGPRRETEIGENLILDTLGAWLPDLTQRERLRRSSLYPEKLLDAMVNFEVLGEGDCALIELNFYNQTCKSKRTCEFSDELAAMPNELNLTLLPGQPGSPLTHLGTNRSDLATRNGCGSAGGGAAPTGCFGPELRGHQGRFFPLDPELDRVMSCTLEVFDGADPSVSFPEYDLDFDVSCLVSGPEDEGDTTPPPDTGSEIDESTINEARDAAAALLRGEGELNDVNRQRIIDTLRMRFAEAGVTDAELEAVIDEVADLISSEGLSLGRGTRSDHPMETRTRFNDNTGEVEEFSLAFDEGEFNEDLTAMSGGVPADKVPELTAEYLTIGFLHEALHMVMHKMTGYGLSKDIWEANPLHHTITNDLGLNRRFGQSCDLNSANCSSSCGFGDNRVQRFTECLEGDQPAPIDRCAFAEDYCPDRSEGTMWFEAGLSCGSPTIDYPPLCAAVTCDGSSDLTSACCGGGGSDGVATPPPFPWSINPGPHPGDPDGPYGGIPGGPGGVPFPPLPPIF